MAIYGVSFYGQDKYGPPTYVDFSVGDFVADPQGFDLIDLTWTSPRGDWDRMRVVRNWNGFPVDESDGEILVDTDGALAHLVDRKVRPGAWHYYAIWILSGGDWYRAGISTTLMTADNGYGERLFDHLPMYHKMLQGVVDDLPAVENTTLKTFLGVLGSGLDYLKTYYDSLRVLNDPMKNHLSQLVALAEQFGIDYTPVTPSHLFRSRVLNAGTLARQKGTPEHIRSVIGMTVGWNIEANLGPNMMLNEDAASFVHPSYDLWDSTVNYAAKDRVKYNGYTYQCQTGGAYGTSQAPSGTNTSNTKWTWLNGDSDTTLVDSDGAVAGWESQSFTAGVSPGTYSASIGVGVQSATDATVSSANALLLVNKSGVTADLGVHSTAGSAKDQLNAVLRGVPIPAPAAAWDATVQYDLGDRVTYKNLPYRALTASLGAAPSGTTANNASWSCLGRDDREQFTSSVYIKGQTGFQDRLAYPVVEFFDDRGKLLATLDTSTDASVNIFDGFSNRAGTLTGRTTDVGGKTWTIDSGGWTVSDRGFVYPTATSSMASVTGAADGRVSVTFHSAPAGTQKQAVVFRAASATSYLKATRTALYSTSGSTDTLIANYTTPFSDGDRMTVTFTGSAITVLRNGSNVLSASSTINQTSTKHGILVK